MPCIYGIWLECCVLPIKKIKLCIYSWTATATWYPDDCSQYVRGYMSEIILPPLFVQQLRQLVAGIALQLH